MQNESSISQGYYDEPIERSRQLSVLNPGQLYVGTVYSVNMPDGTFTVTTEGTEKVFPGCVWAAGVFSEMCGFKTSFLPSIGTKVLFFYPGQGQPVYVVSAAPQSEHDLQGHFRNVMDPQSNYAGSRLFMRPDKRGISRLNGNKPPIDMTEGELDISNLMGVGLTLLRHFSKLSAGQLATIECCLLNDMVRIVSDRFEHYTSFGSYRVYNDGGRLNVVWDGTSKDYEAAGLKHAKDAKAVTVGENVIQQPDDPLADARNRFSLYLGHLGNFIHLFVTDPTEQIGRIAETSLRSGKARIHVADDGTILMQSVADIVMEKVVRIPVPVQKRRQDDPSGNKPEDVPASVSQLETWKPSDSANVFEMAFQLREYARWLNNRQAYQQFRMQDRDWRVPSEKETPAPDINSDDVYRKEANGDNVSWRIAYATIRIYRDGSVQMVDAYGNAYTSTYTGIQISSTKDIRLEAAGSVNIIAGQSVNVLARDGIGLSAITGGLWLRAGKSVQLLAQTGNIVVDAIAGVLKSVCGINVNNKAAVTTDGQIVATNKMVAGRVEAAQTMQIHSHEGHIFPVAAATVTSIPETFAYPSSYTGATLYETLSQQAFRAGEATAKGEWKFSDNFVDSQRGGPWPGEGMTQRAFKSSATLQTPSADHNFSNTPTAITHGESIVIKYV